MATVATTGNYNDLENRPQIPQIPADVSAFNNDKGYLTTETDPTISAWAKEANKPQYDYSEIKNTPTIPTVPTNVSAFTNHKGYLTSETDPTISSWAKAATKPTYNYSEIKNTPTIPTVPTKVSAFENDAKYLTSYTETDPTISAWAKEPNKPQYDYSEIQNTPTLSTVATSGSYNDLQNLPQIPQIPADVSAFNNDKGYLTTETDPTISAWAKEASKPQYDYSEIQNTPTLATVATTGNYSDLQNTPTIPSIPTSNSAFTNDEGYLTTETDPTISAWAKEPNKPQYDYSGIQNTPTLSTVATSGSYNDLQNLPQIPQIPADVSAFENDKGYLTEETDPTISAWAKEANKPQYDYTEIQNTPTIPTVPTKVSAFENDANYLTSFTEQQILSISNDTLFLTGGSFVKLPEQPTKLSQLTNDVHFVTEANVQEAANIPTKVSAFENDKGYLTEETDPTISAWAKEASKPQYDYSEIQNTPTLATVATTGNYNDLQNTPTIPSIPTSNSAFTNDEGYLTTETDPTISAWAKEPNKPQYDYSEIQNTPTLATVATTGNYNDLQNLPQIPQIPTDVSAFNNDKGYLTEETDPTISAWAKEANKPQYDYSEIQNTPTIPTVPTNVSAFTNDKGYLTEETDPTISAWAKEANKPQYDYAEIQNTPTIPTVPTNVSAFENDKGYLTEETDPTISAWAKEANKPQYDYSEIQNTPTIPTVPTKVSAFENDANYLTSYTEQQVLSISNDTIYLTGGSFAKLPAGFSGSYNDLTDKPTIPTVPSNVSTFTNDAGYLTMDSIAQYNMSPNDIQALFDKIEELEQELSKSSVVITHVGNPNDYQIFIESEVMSSGSSYVTERGICWNQSENPTIADNHISGGRGIGAFTSLVENLNNNATYFFRAYAINGDGVSYGEQVSVIINVPECGTVTDIDGNTYNTVQIGEQCWMKENLRTSKFSNGTTIQGYKCYGGNFTASLYHTSDGTFYNGVTVAQSVVSNALCPQGWHVPSVTEWVRLYNYVCGQSQYQCSSDSTSIMKALASTKGWDGSSTGECHANNHPWDNNATGFSAVPSKSYYFESGFSNSSGLSSSYWSSTCEVSGSWSLYVNCFSIDSRGSLGRQDYRNGHFVRCLKN